MSLTDLTKQPINIKQPDYISVGVTWVSGKIFIKPDRSQSRAFYGVCHYSNGIWMITPEDYQKPLMITTIIVTPPNALYAKPFCEKGHCCIHFDCPINRFDKDLFVNEFKDTGLFSLALPKSILEKKTQWFNTPERIEKFWKGLAIRPEGGILKFSKEKYAENIHSN